ncbi:pyridoxal phosphate-dependent transferase [Aspergillus undulatus]|uniref:pyridoxal phosphate-dependent transferase n=1 Tax=Aspergillus undulatus TaxID=1810928 RepID=UPI003CCD0E80
MSPFDLETCARPNILSLQPYRCARDDFKADGANVLLDLNENAYGPALQNTITSASPFLNPAHLHRYPDRLQTQLKHRLCAFRNSHAHSKQVLTPDNIFLGTGSVEAIDALIRAFCTPRKDSILICPPTYGMYAVSAQVNDVAVLKIPLLSPPTFALNLAAILHALSTTPNIKLIYLASPGNPTGSLLSKPDILHILAHPTWNGILVLDEAYVDFASLDESASLAGLVTEFPNLVVLHTLSKAFGVGQIRSLTDGNFLMFDVLNELGELDNAVAGAVYEKLAKEGVLVRFRGEEVGCHSCLRVTVGAEGQNDRFLNALKKALVQVHSGLGEEVVDLEVEEEQVAGRGSGADVSDSSSSFIFVGDKGGGGD